MLGSQGFCSCDLSMGQYAFVRLLQQCSQRQGDAASCPPLLIAALLDCLCGSWPHGLESARPGLQVAAQCMCGRW